MNIANKITVSRIILIPLFMLFMLINVPFHMEIALFLFIIASATDKLDGYYARKYNLVTDLGKFLDPLADKLLISGAFLIFIQLGRIEAWIVFVILAREFAVTGLRGIAANKKIVIAASNYGKIKTVVQIITIIILFLNNFPFSLIKIPMDVIFIYLSLLITVLSGTDYFAEYIKAISKNKNTADDEVLESVVNDLLQQKKKTVAFAESCTGGLISSRFTDIPNASVSFLNGVICYSNEAKINMLGVNRETIEKYGAVSIETAREMALGIKKASGTDIGVSITGIAGPSGGSEAKPVGLCYIGIAIDDDIKIYSYTFSGNRREIKRQASTKALDILRRTILSVQII